MTAAALGHRIETLNEGATCFMDGEGRPMPLADTKIDVQVSGGIATITTTRIFRNAEEVPIEAVLTMPCGFDAVVTGLSAQIGERRFEAKTRGKRAARESYEAAIDEGRMAVLHEEVLRGVHVLSVGSLPAGREVKVTLETVAPMTNLNGVPFLRIPVTVGQLYGTSPLLPADDLVTSDRVRHEATLTVSADEGLVRLVNTPEPLTASLRIALDKAIEVKVEGGVFGQHHGTTADGRKVSLSLSPQKQCDAALDLAILVDRSGSTASGLRRTGTTVFSAMQSALERELGRLGDADRITLWQFDSTCERLGAARGASARKLASSLGEPRGGTELGGAVEAVLASDAKHVLVLTDGMTHAATVEQLKASEARISAILVGRGSLDAHVGQICAMTGGQVFYAGGEDVSSALRTALGAMRRPGGHVVGELGDDGLVSLSAIRGGVEIIAEWGSSQDTVQSDAVGRYTAALALPLLSKEAAMDWAEANGLCSHLTSLILTDTVTYGDGGLPKMRKIPLKAFGSATLSASRSMRMAEIPPAASFDLESCDMENFAPRRLVRSQRTPSDSTAGPRFKRYSHKLSPTAAEHRAMRLTRSDAERLAKALDWAHLGSSLAAGDLDEVSVDVQSLIGRLARMPEIQEAARRIGSDPLNIAIGLLAFLARTDRYAHRVARNVGSMSSFAVLAKNLWHDEILPSS